MSAGVPAEGERTGRDMEVRIQLINGLSIDANGAVHDNVSVRSRKGAALIKHLILQRGKAISSQRLSRELCVGMENPENALKTLVSRTRSMLNAICPGLGACIVSTAGCYKWETPEWVTVDVLQIMDILDRLHADPDPDTRATLTDRLIELYVGELEDEYWLHREYLEAVYAYVEQLKAAEAFNRVCQVCQSALKIDELDEQLHISLMEAMANLNRADEAMAEYTRVARRSREYFDAEPSEDLQACYQNLVEEGQSVKFNLDVIHNELTREEKELRGPYFCDYRAFKEIYNIQIRNLERLGSTMFLGVIMLGSRNTVSREGGMAVLLEILRNNLRKGDIVTRFSENIVAMLLPTVNYSTGTIVMDRIEKLFYNEYPSSHVAFHSRISPLGGRQARPEKAGK